MKPRIIIFIFLPLALAVIIGWRLWGYSPASSPPARSQAELAREGPGAAAKEKDRRAAANYIAGAAQNGVLPEASDPAAQEDIGQWERRILAYAGDREAKAADPAQVHALAVKTASLFRLLADAAARQKAGQEPYTAEAGFNTMTLVMNMENEFAETLGLEFADFLDSLDEDSLKRLIE